MTKLIAILNVIAWPAFRACLTLMRHKGLSGHATPRKQAWIEGAGPVAEGEVPL